MFDRLFKSSPPLTSGRIRWAYVLAAMGDGLQLAFGHFGWAGPDQLIDVVLMILQWRLLGFHPLLLPTFVLELFPLVDMLPTWFGCVALVINLRKGRPGPGDAAGPPTIDLPAEPPRLTKG